MTGHGPKQAQFYKWYKWPQLHISFNLLEILRNLPKFWHFFLWILSPKRICTAQNQRKRSTVAPTHPTQRHPQSHPIPSHRPGMQQRPGFETHMTNWRIVEKVRAEKILWQKLYHNGWCQYMSVCWDIKITESLWRWGHAANISNCAHRTSIPPKNGVARRLREGLLSPLVGTSSTGHLSHLFSSTVHWHVDYMENTAIPNGKIIMDSWLGVVSGLYSPANLIPFTFWLQQLESFKRSPPPCLRHHRNARLGPPRAGPSKANFETPTFAERAMKSAFKNGVEIRSRHGRGSPETGMASR